jgi:HAD superfamily hydrolase (TIGR01484 family)
MNVILLATDLDRTLLPNGAQAESPLARVRFRRLTERPEICLVYVTGRHQALVRDAIETYELPRPHFVIADVGTSLYEVRADGWYREDAWQQHIIRDWNGCGHEALAALIGTVPGLHLQEVSQQGACKLSYYAPPLPAPGTLLAQVRRPLESAGVHASLVWSVDETASTGLLDILPACAGKYPALDYLRTKLDIPLARTVFAGDSGNDMSVLVSRIPSVLVANADAAVRAEAMSRTDAASLYLARGGLFGMNGNYSAGILEGVGHFLPQTRAWMTLSGEQADTPRPV